MKANNRCQLNDMLRSCPLHEEGLLRVSPRHTPIACHGEAAFSVVYFLIPRVSYICQLILLRLAKLG